jgi:hypothetical protein
VRFVAGEACLKVMSTVVERHGGIYIQVDETKKKKEKISGQLLDRTY